MYSIINPPSETKAKAIIRSAIWPNSHPVCPFCKRTNVRTIEDRYFCRKCRRKFSLISGTWLKGCRLSFQAIWKMVYLWQKEYTPGKIAEQADVSAQCVSFWLPRFRDNIKLKISKLSGIVEVDETCVAHKKHGGQMWIIGAIERSKPRKIALYLTTNREQETTDQFLLNHVSQRSLVITDGWQGYTNISEFFGYGHEVAIHENGNLGPTNRIENLWSVFDRWRLRQYGTPRRSHLQGIMCEFQARFCTPEMFDNPLYYLKNSLSAVPTS